MIDIEHPEITHARKTGYATYEEFKHDGLQEEGCEVCGEVSEEELLFEDICNDCASNLNKEGKEDGI